MKRVMVVGDLEVAIEEEQNIHIDVAEVCVSRGIGLRDFHRYTLG